MKVSKHILDLKPKEQRKREYKEAIMQTIKNPDQNFQIILLFKIQSMLQTYKDE